MNPAADESDENFDMELQISLIDLIRQEYLPSACMQARIKLQVQVQVGWLFYI